MRVTLDPIPGRGLSDLQFYPVTWLLCVFFLRRGGRRGRGRAARQERRGGVLWPSPAGEASSDLPGVGAVCRRLGTALAWPDGLHTAGDLVRKRHSGPETGECCLYREIR